MRSSSWLVIFLALATGSIGASIGLAGCKTSDPAAADPPKTSAGTAAEPAKPAEAPKEALKLGEPVTAQLVSLSDVAKSPAAFKGKTIATTGTVRAVCQHRGCWMEIEDTTQHATVRMHGHSFFVPKSSSGKRAKVQGTIVLTKDGKECDDMSTPDTQLELDATGVELM